MGLSGIAGRRLWWALVLVSFSAVLSSPQAPRPDSQVVGHMRAGLEARKERRWEDAAREFEAALRLAPNLAEAHANLGVIRQQQGDMSAAAAAFERALQLRPDLRGVHGMLGFSLLMAGRPETAIPHLEAGRKEEPDNPRLASWLALAHLEAGDFGRSVIQWEAARRATPKDINVLLYLARAYDGLLGELHDELYRLDPIKARDVEPEVRRPVLAGAAQPSVDDRDHRAEAARWEAARRSDPRNVEAAANLARAYRAILDQVRREAFLIDPGKAKAAFEEGAAPAGDAPGGGTGPATAVSAAQREPLIREACSQCHRFPPPSVLPKKAWYGKVEKMLSLANVALLSKYNRPIRRLRHEDIAAYFETLAPEELETPRWGPEGPPSKVRFERRKYAPVQPGGEIPGSGNVQLLDLFDDVPGRELVVCDMFSGWVSWTDPRNRKMGLQGLVRLTAPDHAEVVDLDRDGRKDLLVADLGQVMPSDKRLGSVVWLRRTGGREFEAVRLARNLGRVADAQAADFDGDGDLDIIVAEFGWITVGRVLLLENNGIRAGVPDFTQRTVDDRNGAIHVPVADLDKDGRPDFVALISQHHETVVAFLSRGQGRFERREIFTAPHPHWGFSGMEMIDFDGDGDLDILVSNGDTMDDMIRFKPFQGISWLENRGAYPFEHHAIASYYGVERAEAGDLDGDGDLDIAASVWLPELDEAERGRYGLPGVAWYERVEGGKFIPHVISAEGCDRPTLEVGDADGDGLPDVITGTAWLGRPPAGTEPVAVDIWRQLPRP